jgi:hypothetical protein
MYFKIVVCRKKLDRVIYGWVFEDFRGDLIQSSRCPTSLCYCKGQLTKTINVTISEKPGPTWDYAAIDRATRHAAVRSVFCGLSPANESPLRNAICDRLLRIRRRFGALLLFLRYWFIHFEQMWYWVAHSRRKAETRDGMCRKKSVCDARLTARWPKLSSPASFTPITRGDLIISGFYHLEHTMHFYIHSHDAYVTNICISLSTAGFPANSEMFCDSR